MFKFAEQDLVDLAKHASDYYYVARSIQKDDGTVRECLVARPPLKSVHGRIQHMILENVSYPPYLQGGIKDRDSPRGQAANARLHLRPRTLITLDIRTFFDDVTPRIVYDIWRNFFNFSPTVADCLTRLTTCAGKLPQGAKTSSLLANLVFWNVEPELVESLRNEGIVYSRLADDISMSSKARLSDSAISSYMDRVRGMCEAEGFRLRRKKQTVSRGEGPMLVTQLLVNERVAIPTEVRSKIRTEAYRVAHASDHERREPGFEKQQLRVLGRISYLKQHHQRLAQDLRELVTQRT